MLTKKEIAGLTKLSKEHNLPLDQVIKEYKEYHALLDNLQEQINLEIFNLKVTLELTKNK
jgi:hypothetical protein